MRELPLLLEGQLIYLKQPEEPYYNQYQSILNHSGTMRFLGYMNKAPIGWRSCDVKERMERNKKLQRNLECWDFYIFDKLKDAMIGSCGFNYLDMHNKRADFGLIIHENYWRRGIALECHLLCLDYAFTNLGLHRVEFSTTEENKGMQYFLEMIGASHESTEKEAIYDHGKFIDNLKYTLFEESWSYAKKVLSEKISSKLGKSEKL